MFCDINCASCKGLTGDIGTPDTQKRITPGELTLRKRLLQRFEKNSQPQKAGIPACRHRLKALPWKLLLP